MKVRGELKVTGGLILMPPKQADDTSEDAYVFGNGDSSESELILGDLVVFNISSKIYKKAGSFVRYGNDLYISIVKNARGEDIADENVWRKITVEGSQLTQNQLNAIKNANNPSGVNAFATMGDISNFALQSHTHASIDVEPDPRKVDKVTTLGDERVYIINADGTQGTKKVSDFSSENKLNKDFSTLPAAVLPLAGNETVAINQGGQPKTVSLSEIKSTSNFIPEEFIYTSGPQEFYTGYAIAQVLLVFVGGQKITDFTYTTTSFKVGATSAIVPGTTVSIVYIEQLAGANLFYTKAEVNGLIKKPRFEVCFKKSGDINREMSLEPLGTRFLTARYTLKEMSIVFDEQAVDTNKAIPIDVSLISTNSGAPTSSVVYTALCNATTGQIYNKTYVFTMDLLLTPNTILAVTTGAFTEGAQVLKGCWVTLALEDAY